jgi:two-component system, response regulator PdtaR
MTRLGPVVLIVEDEFLLRLDSAETIESAGFEVIQAANADEAIAILKARPDIHVVFTDIQMSGSMDGLKLARFVRDRWPPIKIEATSGRRSRSWRPRAGSSSATTICRMAASSCRSRIAAPRWSRRCAR